MAKRDEFLPSVKLTLAHQVCNHCSVCMKPTSAPHTDEDKAINLGVAAHITAASVGGPRYDASLTNVDRSSIYNGIWACRQCGTLIDADQSRFTVEELRSYKQKAIEHWRNQTLASKSSQIRFIIDELRHYRCSGRHPRFTNTVYHLVIGKFYCHFRLRLRNESTFQQILHKPIVEIRSKGSVIFAEDLRSITELQLPVGDWVSTKQSTIVLPQPQCNFIDEGDELYLTFTVFGEGTFFEVKLLDITEQVREKNHKCNEGPQNMPGNDTFQEHIRKRLDSLR